MGLTLVHWVYLFFIVVIVTAMIFKRDVVLPSLTGLFFIGLVYAGKPVEAVQILFKGLLTAGTELFDIILVIALMIAMLKSLQEIKADVLMVAPALKLMSSPNIAFWALGGAMYLAAIFFWPTPATALVGTILLPVAVKSGMPAIYAAMSVNILGHGMALSGDPVIQGAPGISERTIGLAEGSVLPYGVILSLITGAVASLIAFWLMKREMKAQGIVGSAAIETRAETDADTISASHNPKAKFMAVLVPIILVVTIIAMITLNITGGGSTALLGGVGLIILAISSVVQHGHKALEEIVNYLKEGFIASIKIFTPVIPIAAFFFLGSESAAAILGEGAAPLLFDLGTALANKLPLNSLFLAFGNLVIGIITGLDGSGFSGLPLTASLAEALGGPTGINIPALAAVGQMGAVWSGGGTLTAWAFGLVATAGVAGITPLELARRNFVPVISGLIVSTIFAVIVWM